MCLIFWHLTSFWQFDIFLTIWYLFDHLTSFWPFVNLNHLSLSQGYFSKSLSNFFDPPNFGILTHKLAQMCNYIKSGIPYFFFFYGSGLRAMAVRKICHFWPDRRIVDLCHEGSTILMQCHLRICRGPFYLPKATFWEFVRLTVFS